MRVALYIRVSTLDQNPEAQRRELEQYAARHEWPIAEVFEDQASGADQNRPALARLIDAAHKGTIDTVLVWKLDRFGRSLIDLLDNITVLETERVRFIATSQGIDTGDGYSNPTARFFLHILASVAELERGIIKERVRSGMARYKEDLKQGRVGKTVHTQSGKDLPPGRPRRVFDIERVLELKRKGATIRQISATLGVPRSTIEVRLKSHTDAKTASGLGPAAAALQSPAQHHSPGPGGQGKAGNAVQKRTDGNLATGS